MVTGIVLLLALGVLGLRLPVPYAALGPGPTVDTLGVAEGGREIISVRGRSERSTKGHLNLTTVAVRDRLDLLTALRGWLDPKVAVVPRDTIYPPGKSQQQVDRENTDAFAQSQSSAEFAALGELGYPQQVVVQGLADNSPSVGKLAGGDVLDTVNGTKVRSYDDVTAVLTKTAPGTRVALRYARNGSAGTATVTATKAADRQGAALGVILTLQRKAPFTVSIDVGEDIGGPSAGLMFALGILEKVGPRDLTGEKFIAGTGTIDFDGSVGPIGGIPLKMIGAREKGATVFLVPAGNCADAVHDPPAGLRLVKVETLRGAVDALGAVQAGRPTPSC